MSVWKCPFAKTEEKPENLLLHQNSQKHKSVRGGGEAEGRGAEGAAEGGEGEGEADGGGGGGAEKSCVI
jgi:hypothetical protein